MKKAVSYMRGQRVYTHASSKTTAGVWILELPVLMANATDEEALGQQVMKALSESKVGVPHPTSWTGLFEPVLQLAGVKTWTTFIKGARCVQVEGDADHVAFVSTENLGAKGGFKAINRSEMPAGGADVKAIGGNLLAAFSVAK